MTVTTDINLITDNLEIYTDYDKIQFIKELLTMLCNDKFYNKHLIKTIHDVNNCDIFDIYDKEDILDTIGEDECREYFDIED